MVIVQNVLVSDEVFTEYFLCQLNACKGACCWEGDFGAPLAEEELRTLEEIYPAVRPWLTPAGQAAIDQNGPHEWYEDAGFYGTLLLDGGPCAFMTTDEQGQARCGIEQAWRAGDTDFRKPVSCHLYPLRVISEPRTGFEAINYDRWDICSAACSHGRRRQLPLYQFAREAIIRKYGEDFYAELADIAADLQPDQEP